MRWLFVFLLLVLSNTSAALCDSGVPEDFGKFREKFSAEKVFAIERTLYPLYSLRNEYGVENGKDVHSVVKTLIAKSKDADFPTINEILVKNNMESKIKLLTVKNAVVDVFKPETDWLLSYHFIARGSCWYLHHIEDHSL